MTTHRLGSRRGHTAQISISDTNHHVTEAIGGMYGSDDDDYASSPQRVRDDRPLSYLHSPKEVYDTKNSYFETRQSSPPRLPLAHTVSNEQRMPPSPVGSGIGRKSSLGGENNILSPPPLARSTSQETAVQQFPLNDIDYESSPAAVAQELSNLQAIRRMSMNVDTADPDLPTFSSGFGIPPQPPSPSAGEDDPSKLFWVPARLHPELAPKEFKTFLEERVEKMQRLSNEGLSPDNLSPSDSGSLKRKKSMLSRQVETGKGYEDGAERLERKRSEGKQLEPDRTPHLAELEKLVEDPTTLIRKMSLGTRRSEDSGVEIKATEDAPILPGAVGLGLKRSTRTNYRRGSLRKGERQPFSARRATKTQADVDTDESLPASPVLAPDQEPILGLTRVQTEPSRAPSPQEPEQNNFSRPNRKRPGFGPSASVEDLPSYKDRAKSPDPIERSSQPEARQAQPFQSRIASGGWTTASLPGQNAPIPHIIETPPETEKVSNLNNFVLPERRSSHQPPPVMKIPAPVSRPVPLIQGARSKISIDRPTDDTSLDDISSHPSPFPGTSSRTDDLTLVPTFHDKKTDPKGKKNNWGWLLGNEEKEKEREKEREREREKEREKERKREEEVQRQREKDEKEKEKLRKPKISSKLAPPSDKTRLDLLQTSIDSGSSRGRESVVLDRESIKLEEERKKESKRRSDKSDEKKEKDGIFSSIFGGKKTKTDDPSHKKRSSADRKLSPEPPPRILKPDIDYNWTRFSILEERAIYRMAHIKLANPKRALYSQVLLSNFMYSYLAKVQMMHPQMQIPAQQKSAQQQQREKEEKQVEEYLQYQRWQEVCLSCLWGVNHVLTSSAATSAGIWRRWY